MLRRNGAGTSPWRQCKRRAWPWRNIIITRVDIIQYNTRALSYRYR